MIKVNIRDLAYIVYFIDIHFLYNKHAHIINAKYGVVLVNAMWDGYIMHKEIVKYRDI